jgi:predicted transcriptional regulator
MTSVTIHLSSELENQIKKTNINKEEYILQAVKEKLDKENHLKNQLKEGYKSTYVEDKELSQEFDQIDINEWPQ